ncbi:MAG: 3-oxoacyl-ACP synthase [Rhodospirillaceae bacterium]|nr:3-oxoacyl-ACP synthase [Rhodospirillaceae bacterium]|tara:strand:+ start:1067 stop:2056 length:990 start_codon:yes stop_codon:yes gene_type:complete
MTSRRSFLVGCGSYLPERILHNYELARLVDTSDEWIVQRTGIRQRHVAADGELTSDLAIEAAKRALTHSGVSASEIDLIIIATTTPDETFPATATKVQAELEIYRGAAFDIQAVCAGFVYALAVADNFLKTGQASKALVVGAETFTRILDWSDRGTCVLFGDGAGAVILSGHEVTKSSRNYGILSTHLHSDGRERDILFVDGGPSKTGTVGQVRMSGQEVFKHAVSKLGSVLDEVLEANEMSSKDIDWLVPHQANRRIIDSMAKRMKLPADKVICCIDRHANTSAASVPLALAEGIADGRIRDGDLVLFEAIGGGLAWGAGLVRMGYPK